MKRNLLALLWVGIMFLSFESHAQSCQEIANQLHQNCRASCHFVDAESQNACLNNCDWKVHEDIQYCGAN